MAPASSPPTVAADASATCVWYARCATRFASSGCGVWRSYASAGCDALSELLNAAWNYVQMRTQCVCSPYAICWQAISQLPTKCAARSKCNRRLNDQRFFGTTCSSTSAFRRAASRGFAILVRQPSTDLCGAQNTHVQATDGSPSPLLSWDTSQAWDHHETRTTSAPHCNSAMARIAGNTARDASEIRIPADGRY